MEVGFMFGRCASFGFGVRERRERRDDLKERLEMRDLMKEKRRAFSTC